MMRVLSLIVAIFLISVSGAGLRADEMAVFPKASRSFKLMSSNGKWTNLADYRGKLVYLDFWASWCPPCKLSLPWMNELALRYSGKGLNILTVNLDTEERETGRILSEIKPEFTVLLDPAGEVPKMFNLRAMPTSFLIRPDGTIASIHEGFHESTKREIESEIVTLLGR